MAVTVLSQRIHMLSIALVNQIAAGEVIQRPASVVKELLENSLDAGASEIKLDIKKGGRLLISIQDNGHGIHPDDLPLALAQHGTSKLMSQTDLERITTLGFRGEALTSIASVSSLKLDNTEFFHIREIVRRIALSRYDVSFHLKHNNKTILQCSGKQKNFAERAQTIFGKTFLANSFELDYERNGLRLWGWFGHPEIARNQVDQQYFYLNGRVIRDKQVNHGAGGSIFFHSKL